MTTHSQIVLALARKVGIVRSCDLAALGIPRAALARLAERGALVRVARGLYVRPDTDVGEFHALALVARRVPHGIICLLSALRFHGLTTQSPFEVWLGVDRTARKPRMEYPPLRVVRFSGASQSFGVRTHRVEGANVLVTTPAKTVADCFKYRNKIGLDVAIEALREYRRARLGTVDELWKAAQACRVARIIRPYLEMTA